LLVVKNRRGRLRVFFSFKLIMAARFKL